MQGDSDLATAQYPLRARDALCGGTSEALDQPLYATRFACQACGTIPAELPTRCFNAACGQDPRTKDPRFEGGGSLVCYECAVRVDANLQTCGVCKKRARASATGGLCGKATVADNATGSAAKRPAVYARPQQRAIDWALTDALSLLYPDSNRADTVERVVQRHTTEALAYVANTAKLAQMPTEEARDAYLQDTQLMVRAHALQGDLAQWIGASMCDCSPPMICVERRSAKDGRAYRSCPAFDLHERRAKGRSSTGCKFFKYVV